MMISGALAEGRRCLAANSPTPDLDAEVLLAHVLNGTRSSLIAAGRDPLDPRSLQRFDQLIQRRQQGEPVAYITGEKEFWSLKLKVTPDVLVPRPETELLVEWALEIIDSSFPRRRESSISVLDLGTGSGAIALALATELRQATVLATDNSAKTLAVAESNARSLAKANVSFALGHWFTALDSRFRCPGPQPRSFAGLEPPLAVPETPRLTGNDGKVNFIVSNPPYVAENDPHLADLRFEPRLALTAGPDGLSALRQITADAGKYLKPGGWLLLEHGAEQGAAVRALFQTADFGKIETRRDLAGHERATAGQNP